MAQTRIIGGGVVVPGSELGVDPTFQAARTSNRPLDYAIAGQVLGHYRVSAPTGALTFSANAVLFSFRWADASRYLVLTKLNVNVNVVTAVTAQRIDNITCVVQRNYTSSETTGINSFLPTNNKARIIMGNTVLTQLGAASLAAGITGGTKVADNVNLGSVPVAGISALGTATGPLDLLGNENLIMHPQVFSANEGLTVSWGATALATGSIVVTINIAWAEVAVF